MGTEIDSTGAKSRYLAALRDHSPVERGRHKVMLHHSPERGSEPSSATATMMPAAPSNLLRHSGVGPLPPPPPPPPRVTTTATVGAQSIVSKWADRSRETEHIPEESSTSDFFIPVESPPPPPPPRSSSLSTSSSSASSAHLGIAPATSPTSQSSLGAWKQRQQGRNTMIPPPFSSTSPKAASTTTAASFNKTRPKPLAKLSPSIPSPTSSSSLHNQPWVKKRNLSVSTTVSESSQSTADAAASQSGAFIPQLAHQKNQWDAQRDIPRGTVAQKLAGQLKQLQATRDQPIKRTTSAPIHKLPGRLPQPSPEVVLPPSATTAGASIGVDNVLPVQPPPSPRHARQQLSPNYNNGTGNEKDERMWGASSTSPRLAASATAPKLSSQHHLASSATSISSDPFSSSSARLSKTTSTNNARLQAPFPDRHPVDAADSSSITSASISTSTVKSSSVKSSWNAFPVAPPPPPPPPSGSSPLMGGDQDKNASAPLSPGSWQPKVASPKGRLTNNFFVQADSPRREGASVTTNSLDAATIEAIGGPKIFWGDESVDDNEELRGLLTPSQDDFQEPEPVKSPVRAAAPQANFEMPVELSASLEDPFQDMRNESVGSTTTPARDSFWPSKNSGVTAAPAPPARWPTSRFMEDEVDWFERGHVFSTDTNESGSLQNSQSERKTTPASAAEPTSSSSRSSAMMMAEELEEKKSDEVITRSLANTTTSPRNTGGTTSPKEVGNLAKSKSFSPPPEVKEQEPEANFAISPRDFATAVTTAAIAKTPSPTKAAGGVVHCDSGSKSVTSSNATTASLEDEVAPVSAQSSTATNTSKKNRLGIFNIFGTGKNKKSKDAASVASNSKQASAVKSVNESITSAKSPEQASRATQRTTKKEQVSTSASQEKAVELSKTKSHEASSYTNVPHHASLTYNRSEGDDTTISEMTNPTVFQYTRKELEMPEPAVENEDDLHEAVTPKMQMRNEHQRPFDLQPVTTTASPAEVDPFDVNSPVFASGDPFSMFGVSKSQSKESFSVSDPFFDAEEASNDGDDEEEDDEEEEASKEYLNLDEPDPPLEHVDLLSSDDEDDDRTKSNVKASQPQTIPPPVVPDAVAILPNEPLAPPVTVPVVDSSAIKNDIINKLAHDMSVSSDPVVVSPAGKKSSTVASTRSVPEIKTLQSVASMRANHRARSGKKPSATAVMAPVTSEHKPVQQSDKSVPAVAPRFFASVAKSRQRTVTSSSASLPEKKSPKEVAPPSTLTVAPEYHPSVVVSEPIPETVDVSSSSKRVSTSKSPKSFPSKEEVKVMKDLPSATTRSVLNTVSARSTPEHTRAIPVPEDDNVDPQRAVDKVEQPLYLAEIKFDSRSVLDNSLNVTTSLADTQSSTMDSEVTPTISGSVPSRSSDWMEGSTVVATEITEAREPDSVESARLATANSNTNVNVLLMRRRNEKRRQVKEGAGKQLTLSSVKQKPGSEKETSVSSSSQGRTSAYLTRFSQRKAAPIITSDTSKESSQDSTPLPPPPPAIERIHADFDREISKLMPKINMPSSTSHTQQRASKDVEINKPEVENTKQDGEENKQEVKKVEKSIPELKEVERKKQELKEVERKKQELKEVERKQQELTEVERKKQELKEVERRKPAAPIPEDGSINSSGSSYRSRKPRSILRKARRGLPDIASSPQSVNDVVDPMHRAGLRLLAAAIIPIQCAARRFLARREIVSRLWAIVVMQAYFRRWLAELAMSRHFASVEIQTCYRRWIALRTYRRYRAAVEVQKCFRRWTAERWFKQYTASRAIQTSYRCWSARTSYKRSVNAVVAIQTLFRGWFARDCLLYKHYSAMQIQRMVRGYLATIYVYEYIYKVTIVQSCYRRKVAIDDAAYRLSFIIQLQSIIRGYLVLRNVAVAKQKAVLVQTAWRCYYNRLNYRFDLIDIIIVQNIWRQKSAKRLVSEMRYDRTVRSATKIQAQWRSYDCTMNYLHYLADVLIAQSAARRWMARRLVARLRFSNAVTIQKTVRSYIVRTRLKKRHAAIAIQRTWRGFVCYADYMFTVADIVIVQTRVRRVLAKRETDARRATRNYNSAVEIQRRWRGFAAYQRALVMQADIIICQSTARRYLALKRFKQMVRVHVASIKIQTIWRGFTCSRDYLREMSARIIERTWRWYAFHREMQKHRSATCIARSWKLSKFRGEREIASVIIQKYWRRFVKETEYFIMKFEYQAATTIQSAWRRFWNFSNFVIMLDSSIRLQTSWRSFRERTRFSQMKRAAVAIETTARSLIARKQVNRMSMTIAMVERSVAISIEERQAATHLQCLIRGRRIRIAVKLYLSARKIQSWIRGTFARYAVKLYLSARRIQCRFRGARVRVAVQLYLSARRIQAKWRGYRLRHPYLHFISARRIQTAWRCQHAKRAYTRYIASRRIQTNWRCSKARRNYTIFRGEILAATLIQAAWRGFLCYTDYIFTVADVIAAQRVARMYLARKEFLALRDSRDRQIAAIQVQRYWRGFLGRHSASLARALHEREIQQQLAAVNIQRVWRGYDQKQIYWYVLGCAIQIQRFARGKLVRERLKAETWAAITVQALSRRYFCRIEYHKRMIDAMLVAVATEESRTRLAATAIQNWWSVFRAKERRNTAAIVIQRFFLMVKAEVDREIQAEKKRRKMRKKMKNRPPQDDDDILERVWMSTISQDETETNVVRYAVSTAAIELGRTRTPGRSSSAPRSVQHAPDVNTQGPSVDDALSWSQLSQQLGDHLHLSQPLPRKEQERPTVQSRQGLRTPVRKKYLLPPTYTNGDHAPGPIHGAEQPPDTVRLRSGMKHTVRVDDDAASEVSGLTTGSSVYRIPPSRLETLSRKEMDEDFSLEEAWIDAEIRNVKERKRTENRENTPIDYVYPFPSPSPAKNAAAPQPPVQRAPLRRDSHRASKSSRRSKQAT